MYKCREIVIYLLRLASYVIMYAHCGGEANEIIIIKSRNARYVFITEAASGNYDQVITTAC